MSTSGSRELLVRGLPPAWSEDDVRRLLEPLCHPRGHRAAAAAVRIRFPRRTGRRGYAFVSCASVAGAEAVIAALDGVEVQEGHLLSLSPVTSNRRDPHRDILAIRFPHLSPEVRRRLRLDEEARFSVTEQPLANHLSRLLLAWFSDDRTAAGPLVITDGCAGGGGNTLSFAEHFAGGVHAVEVHPGRAADLAHNVAAVFGEGAPVKCYRADYIASGLWRELRQDIVFMDPPWGGPTYWKEAAVQLSLSGHPIGAVVRDLHLARAARLTVLKVPLNFDLVTFMRDLSASAEPAKVESKAGAAAGGCDSTSLPFVALLVLSGWQYLLVHHEAASEAASLARLDGLPSRHIIKYTLDTAGQRRRLRPFCAGKADGKATATATR